MALLKDILKQSEIANNNAIKENAEDYINKETGLLMCGKCNTPKQCIVEIEGEVYKPKCLCKCGVEKRDREEAELERREFENRIEKYREMGFPESKMQKWTFSRYFA